MNKIRYIDSLLTSKNEISLFCTLLFSKENMNDSEKAEKFNVPLFE